MEGTYRRDRATGKLRLYFSRADYQALDSALRSELKRYFNFSRYAKAWISKATDGYALDRARSIAERAGLTDGGEEGEALSFAESIEQKQERAERRADRLEARAERKLEEAHAVTKQGTDALDRIPFGQPMMPGHHSYGRDKRYRERAWGKIEKGADLANESKRAKALATTARRTASGKEYDDPAFLSRRIEKIEALIRAFRRSQEKYPESARLQGRMEERIRQVSDRLAFYRDRLEALGGVRYSRESFKERRPAEIKYRGTWYPFERASAKTVTVSRWLGVDSFTWRVPYAEISGVRYADEAGAGGVSGDA